MGQAYVITSGKGGVGKTLTTFNIGVGLSLLGKEVVLIDADICLPNLDKVAGFVDEVRTIKEIMELNGPRYNLEYLLRDNCLLDYVVLHHKRYSHLSFIPAQIIGSKIESLPEVMEELVTRLKDRFDYVLIDCPSGIGREFYNAVIAADNALVIATPDVTSVRDADTIIGKLEEMGISEQTLIVNRMDSMLTRTGGTLSSYDIIEVLAIDLMGIIPEDDRMIACCHKGIPVVTYDKSKAGQGYRNIVMRILGEKVDLLKLDDKKNTNRLMDRISGLLIDYLSSSRKIEA